MNEVSVSRLYDRLCRFESRRASQRAYPVHKRLDFEDSEEMDIYDWILGSVELDKGAKILDAGCGVGFGTLKLAAAGNVTGISVSPDELETAERYARDADASSTVVFRHASFDAPLNERYDLVVAVESLKHSPDIARSLRNLSASLAEDGELIIVEDIFSGPEHGAFVNCLKSAWHLAELHRLEHYTAVLPDCETVDLTDTMHRRLPLWNRVRFFALGVMSALLPGEPGRIMAIFRGGVALECLYDRREMRYLVIRYRKRAGLTS